MRNKDDLKIFVKSFDLSVDIERALRRLKPGRAVADQLRRSINSVADNIAEGCAFDSEKMMRRHCLIALGSLMEAETQLLRMLELDDLGEEEEAFLPRIINIRHQLAGFIRSIESRIDS